jgi:hypothetical protein
MNNAIRTVSLIVGAILEIMAKLGECTVDAANPVCSAPWIPTTYAHYAVLAIIVLNFILKATRPGGVLPGLFGQTAVVVPDSKAGVGTVTATQVAQP